MRYRLGDVVRFRRGTNEYTGEIIRRFRGIDAVRVARPDGAWMVALRNIVRVEVPKLTEKEHATLVALRDNGANGEYTGETTGRGDFARHARAFREMADEGLPVTAQGLTRLMERGLVEGVQVGINSGWTHCTWGLSEEGRRVAADL